LPPVQLIDLAGARDARGNLTVLECGRQVPFAIQRVFLLHDLPADAVRGRHAHRRQHQFLVVTAGAMTITADGGQEPQRFRLDQPGLALHAPPLTWLEIRDPTPGAVLMVLCDAVYDPADYISDRAEFDRLTRA
jgi:hypothetical protein